MTGTEQEITDYVDRVRAALGDLPPAVRDELTEDLSEHLTEVAAEAEGSLVDRLGPPEAYALELRAAAGVGTAGGGRRLGRRFGVAGDRLRARVRRWDVQLGPPLGYATAGEFLRLLRPAWWVLRGYLVALLVSFVLGGHFGLVPRPFLNEGVGLVLLGGSVLASIWLGHHTPGLTRPKRRLLHVATAVLAVFALVVVVNVDERARWGDYGEYQPISVDGRYEHVRDVYVYDSEGRLVENARLFDQNGDPIRLGHPECPDPRDPTGNGNPLLRPYPYCPSGAPFAPRPPGPPVPGLPAPSTSVPTASTTPTATASPTPSAT